MIKIIKKEYILNGKEIFDSIQLSKTSNLKKNLNLTAETIFHHINVLLAKIMLQSFV
jgi:hypothetical protein